MKRTQANKCLLKIKSKQVRTGYGGGDIPQRAVGDSAPNSGFHANLYPSLCYKLREVTFPSWSLCQAGGTYNRSSGQGQADHNSERSLQLPFPTPTFLLGKVTRLWVAALDSEMREYIL